MRGRTTAAPTWRAARRAAGAPGGMRNAFAAVFSDPAFMAEAEKLKLDVSQISADEIMQLTDRVMATPPAVVARIQSLLPGGGQ